MMIILATLLGFVLIMVDLVALPGGVFVVIGSLSILYGIYLNLVTHGPIAAGIHLLLVLATVPFLIRYAFKRVALKGELKAEDGYVGVEDHSELLGRRGVARCDLRPSGTITVMEQDEPVHLDCIAEGGYIDQGAEVIIVAERGPSLVVRVVG